MRHGSFQFELATLNLPQERDLSAEELKTAIAKIAKGIDELGAKVTELEAQVAEIKTELKSWSSWSRFVAGTIILAGFVIFTIVIPLGIALWKQI